MKTNQTLLTRPTVISNPHRVNSPASDSSNAETHHPTKIPILKVSQIPGRLASRITRPALALLACCCVTIASAETSVVPINDDTRFVVLSESLLALQRKDPSGKFPEGVSFAVRNRDFPPVAFDTRVEDGRVWVKTRCFEVSIDATGDPLSLQGKVTSQGEFPIADVQAEDKENFGGFRRSLDIALGQRRVAVNTGKFVDLRPDPPFGLLSRRGWTILSHSPSDALKHVPKEGWSKTLSYGISKNWSELFLFAYGHDFATAWRDYFRLTGNVPLIPRWMLGGWYSRYWEHTDPEYREIVQRFRAEGMPLDGIVVDTSWHHKGWYNVEYNTENFPDMKAFHDWAESQNIKVMFNHHPLQVEITDPEKRKEFLNRIGGVAQDQTANNADNEDNKTVLRDLGKMEKNTIPYDMTNPAHWQAYDQMFLEPLFRDGLDVLWHDTRLGPLDINEMYWQLAERHLPGRRPLTLALPHMDQPLTTHREPIFYVGDSWISWESLRDQIGYFLQHAIHGNIVSMDIGGYKSMTDEFAEMVRTWLPPSEVPYLGIEEMRHPELFARWIQCGVVSPILRLHAANRSSNGLSDLQLRQPWLWGPEVLDSARHSFQLRYRLLPYIYTAMREWHDTGMPLTRPMWVDYPDSKEAYEYKLQYLFGPDLLAAPFHDRSEEDKPWVGSKEVWFPAGVWVDWFTGERITGPAVKTVTKGINEFPLYIREGAVIPCGKYVAHSGEPLNHLVLEIATPENDSSTTARLYEDDGESREYQDKNHRWTDTHFERKEGRVKLDIKAVAGSFPGEVKERSYEVVFRNLSAVPENIELNGGKIAADQSKIENANLVIQIPKQSVHQDSHLSF